MFWLLGLQLLLTLAFAQNLNEASICNYHSGQPIGPCSFVNSNGTYAISTKYFCKGGKVLANTYVGETCSGKLLYANQTQSGGIWNCGGKDNCAYATVTLKYCKGKETSWFQVATVINTCIAQNTTYSTKSSCGKSSFTTQTWGTSETCTGSSHSQTFKAGICNMTTNQTAELTCQSCRMSLGLFAVVLMAIFQLQLLL